MKLIYKFIIAQKQVLKNNRLVKTSFETNRFFINFHNKLLKSNRKLLKLIKLICQKMQKNKN